jgi:hypothetical protein
MPSLSRELSTNVNEILDLALMAERLRTHVQAGPSIRRDLNIHRTRLFYELAFLRLFALWEAFLEEVIIRYLCGYTFAGQSETVINGFCPSLVHARMRLSGNRPYVLLQNPGVVIQKANSLFQANCRVVSVVRSFQQPLELYANVRHRIAHDHQDARQKFDSACMHLAGRRFPGGRPGAFLRENTQFSGRQVRWLERIGRELEGIGGQLS